LDPDSLPWKTVEFKPKNYVIKADPIVISARPYFFPI